jgi:hypothetical protein
MKTSKKLYWKKGMPDTDGWFWIRRNPKGKEGLVWIDIVYGRPVMFLKGPQSSGRFLSSCFEKADKPEYAKDLSKK